MPAGSCIHHFIRKSGHFIGYGFIGLAWLRAWWMTLPRFRFLADALLALLGTALMASCDEWHQILPAQPHRLSLGRAARLLRRHHPAVGGLHLHAHLQAQAAGPRGVGFAIPDRYATLKTSRHANRKTSTGTSREGCARVTLEAKA